VVHELAGTSWSSLATPSAAGLAALRANHPDATLEAVACPATGISCPSVNACVAVGSCAVHSGARYPLVERYGWESPRTGYAYAERYSAEAITAIVSPLVTEAPTAIGSSLIVPAL
jgi:hypothetical protein